MAKGVKEYKKSAIQSHLFVYHTPAESKKSAGKKRKLLDGTGQKLISIRRKLNDSDWNVFSQRHRIEEKAVVHHLVQLRC